MTQVIKFVYNMIIFLFLIIIVKNVDGFRCEEDYECPRRMCPFAYRPSCFLSFCFCKKFML
uniref:Nodule-specific cysteine-rich peptide L14 n=1 Tax=Lens culinaris TaxID=3864 RepID=A0A7T8IG18_LENCU|nr:nodule-specific cysteine-rich peptide L14 [Lens culinaris]